MSKIKDWVSTSRYTEDDVIIVKGESVAFNDRLYRCIVDHTAFSFSTDFGNSLWEIVKTQGIQGIDGAQGLQGAQGDQGLQGNDGNNGGDGADGIFTEIATTIDAQNGTNNTKGMTPLRVKESIDQQLIADRIIIADNTAKHLIAGGNAALSNRILALETNAGIDTLIGEQRLFNNFGPQDILGLDAPLGHDGKGNRLELNSVGARSARIEVEIYRKDDGETRFSTCMLLIHFISQLSKWFVERESTTNMQGDPDGLVFNVTTTNPLVGVYVGNINYTTNDMIGGNYDINSNIRFIIKEIKGTL